MRAALEAQGQSEVICPVLCTALLPQMADTSVCVWGGVYLDPQLNNSGGQMSVDPTLGSQGKSTSGTPKGKEEEKHSPLSNHKNSSCSQDLRLPQALDKPIMKPPIPYIHPSIPRAGGS